MNHLKDKFFCKFDLDDAIVRGFGQIIDYSCQHVYLFAKDDPTIVREAIYNVDGDRWNPTYLFNTREELEAFVMKVGDCNKAIEELGRKKANYLLANLAPCSNLLANDPDDD